jgi:glucose/arabinose dehydrogenase
MVSNVERVFQLVIPSFRRVGKLVLILALPLSAQDQPDYYRTVTLETPAGVNMEASGLALLPDGKLAVSIRKGEVWIIQNPSAEPPTVANLGYKLFASGMHEILGLAYHEGDLYVTQRSEVTRLRDTDKDGVADEYFAASKGWGVSGAYHEYAYGPVFDREGNMHNTLNCSMGKVWDGAGDEAKHPLWRGWSIITKKDSTTATGFSAGFRSPCGIGLNADGDIFGTDQQGNWTPTSPIMHIRQGAYFGHADALKDAKHPDSPVKPPAKVLDGITVAEAVTQVPGYCLPAVWLPYVKFGQSTTGLRCDLTGGKFGPFEKQMFVGEFVLSGVNRVFLEKVGGEYQGACFPFVSGLQSAVLTLNFLADGSMIVGQSNRGWNSYGSRPYGLQRLVPTNKVPLEIQKLEAVSGGFRFTFTEPVKAADWSQTKAQSYTYLHTAKYGSPEVETQPLQLSDWQLSADALSLTVKCGNLRAGYVHEFELPEITSTDGKLLWHRLCAYTLNKLP